MVGGNSLCTGGNCPVKSDCTNKQKIKTQIRGMLKLTFNIYKGILKGWELRRSNPVFLLREKKRPILFCCMFACLRECWPFRDLNDTVRYRMSVVDNYDNLLCWDLVVDWVVST